MQIVLASHSWGDNVFRNFLVWIEEEEAGWVEKHIHAYLNIAGPTLGVPKAVSTYLSGDISMPAGPSACALVSAGTWTLQKPAACIASALTGR